jgi:hypothetical protein
MGQSRDTGALMRLCLPLRIVAALLVAEVHYASGQVAPVVPCDNTIRPVADTSVSYRPRPRTSPNRCEGLYQLPRNATTSIALISLIDDTGTGSSPDLTLRWIPTEHPSLVTIRVDALRTDLYYRLDTRVSADSTRFRWSRALLSSRGVSPRDLIATAYMMADVPGAGEWPVFLPVRLETAAPLHGDGCYRALVRSDVQLHDVSFTLFRSGTPAERIAAQRLVQPIFPEQSPIPIPLPCLSKRGFYRVEVRARGVAPLIFMLFAGGSDGSAAN